MFASQSATALVFHDTTFHPIVRAGQPWLTAAEIAHALGYERDTFVHRLYGRHVSEFTEGMTGVVNLTTPGGEQDARIFSLRGAHLLGMFARTSRAAEFRHWVLDILDREAAPRAAALPEPDTAGVRGRALYAALEVERQLLHAFLEAGAEAKEKRWIVSIDMESPIKCSVREMTQDETVCSFSELDRLLAPLSEFYRKREIRLYAVSARKGRKP